MSDHDDGVPMTLAEAIGLGRRLHAQGDLAQAESVFRQVLAAAPDAAVVLNLLAMVLHGKGDSTGAMAALRRAVAAEPGFADAHTNLGNMLREQGARLEAVAAYRAAVSAQADHADGHANLAVTLGELEQYDEAEQAYRRALDIDPGHDTANYNFAVFLLGRGRDDEAADHCARWYAIAPDNPLARHMAAAGGRAPTPARADDSYVRTVFDAAADEFDGRLADLGYRGPELTGRLVTGMFAERADLRILDAGCGTGLSAPLLSAHAGRLVGVDLSPAMVARAEARGGYDSLIVGELTDYLSGCAERFDVVVSTDTLNYFGDLAEILPHIASVLVPGGVLVFTLEHGIDVDDGYQLHQRGRYRHAPAYVRGALAGAGFEIVSFDTDTLRTEGGKPVDGLIVVVRRTSREEEK